MSPAFPERAVVMLGVSFRPVQMAKQESGERSAADKPYTHTQVIVDDHTGAIAVWELQKRPEAGKVQKPMRNAVHLPEACQEPHWSHCVFILS